MAGSYEHCVDDDGKLLSSRRLQSMLDCDSGDVYEAVEEMYGMIWYLATGYADHRSVAAVDLVEAARRHYQKGLEYSPGTN